MSYEGTEAIRSRRLRRWMLAALPLALGSLLVSACGSPEPTATTRPTQPPAQVATPTPDPFQAEWDALIAAAKQEGQLVVETTVDGAPQWRPVVKAFSEKFGIEAITNGSPNPSTRIVAEQNAGKFLVDIVFESSRDATRRLIPGNAVVPVEDLIVRPDVLDKSKWFGGRYWWGDDEEKFILNFAADAGALPPGDIYINLDVVNPDAIQRKDNFTLWELLADDQPWAGKLVAEADGLTSMWGRSALVPGAGPEWVEAAVTHAGVTWVADRTLQIDGLTSGKFAITLMTSGGTQRNIGELQERGVRVAKLTEFVKFNHPPVITGGGAAAQVTVARNQPHPNAAKLFLNWLLSFDGQTAYQALYGADIETPRSTLRVDNVPPGRVDPAQVIAANSQAVMAFGSAEAEQQVQRGRDFVEKLWACMRAKTAQQCRDEINY